MTFQPDDVHLSLTQVGDNALAIPRSAFPAFCERVPKPVLALNLTVGAFHDEMSGTVFTAGAVFLLAANTRRAARWGVATAAEANGTAAAVPAVFESCRIGATEPV